MKCIFTQVHHSHQRFGLVFIWDKKKKKTDFVLWRVRKKKKSFYFL